MRVTTVPDFFPRARDLRAQFEARVGPNRSSEESRFVWDYWNVPGQFTYVRTPAINVIRPTLLAEFTGALRAWGAEHLGSTQVTVPWLSYYVEGCRQELHSDVVQGMWSYVYSLSPWDDRTFTGGETLLGSDRLLEYWARFDPTRSNEARHLLEQIPACFDQLCVFDSRLPHGVAVVEGTRDPRKGRVALHGWFRDPELGVEGALDQALLDAPLAAVRDRWRSERSRCGPFHGQATWRLSVAPDGSVDEVTSVVDNLVPAGTGAQDPETLLAVGAELLAGMRLPPADGPSTVLVPLDESRPP